MKWLRKIKQKKRVKQLIINRALARTRIPWFASDGHPYNIELHRDPVLYDQFTGVRQNTHPFPRWEVRIVDDRIHYGNRTQYTIDRRGIITSPTMHNIIYPISKK
jgi:hypothetical protein